MSRTCDRGFGVRVLAGLVGIVFAGAVGWPVVAQDAPESRDSLGSIRKVQRLSAEEGVVLTDAALLLTRDGGASWSSQASGERLEGVTDAFWLSSSRVFLAGVDPGSLGRLVVLDTADGGETWRKRRVEPSVLGYGQIYSSAKVHFLDAGRGWLLGKVATSAAFSDAELLRTSDGGATWERLPRPPVAGHFVFVDAERGFMAGAPVSQRLYGTLDGGRSWQELKLPVSAAPGMALYDLPRFHSTRRGTVAVTLRGASPRLLTFVTRDGGQSWRPAASLGLPAGDYDEPVPVALSAEGRVLSLAAQGSVTLAMDATPRAVSLARPERAVAGPPGARAVSVRSLSLGEDGAGWALVAEGSCEEGVCRQVTRLVEVDGSGQAVAGAEDLLVRTEEEVLALEATTSGAVISFDKGFDQCAAGTTAQMQTWKTNSPYKDANIYYGGAARACTQVNLNASWVQTVFGQGWRLIPTWVGPQSPCSGRPTVFSSNATTARSQGLAEADKAVDAAAALGLGAGTPLYYDMELYSEIDTTCSAAVRAFVNAWSERVKDGGYLAGVYGNARNAQADWRSGVIANPPDAVWLTPWVCSGTATSCNWTPTVFGISGLDDAYWANNQRIRQYWGDHKETWGGVTFTIDADYANAPVAAAGPSCQATVPASRWKGEYFNNISLTPPAVMVRDDGIGSLNFNWGSGSPGSSCGVPADNFSARWTRTAYFNGGTYRFNVTSDDGFRLYVDGVLKMSAWIDQGPTPYWKDVTLLAGNHTIVMEYYERGGGAVAKLSWKNASSCFATVPSTSWKGEYFLNKSLSGSTAMVRNDGTGFVNFPSSYASPSTFCDIPADNYSVRWTRDVYFPAGTYQFNVTSDDGFRLYVDGVMKLSAWINQGATPYSVQVPLSAGNHRILMTYFENTGAAVAKLSWKTTAAFGTSWAFDLTHGSSPLPENGRALTNIDRFSRAGGPCYGKAPGTCRFDTRTVFMSGGHRIESITTPNGKFWHFDLDASGYPGWSNNGTDNTQVERYMRTSGPCYGKAFGTCRFDTRTIFYASDGHRIESITTPNGKFWHFDIDAAGIPSWGSNGTDNTQVERYMRTSGPCYGKAAGTCRFDTRTIFYASNGHRIESITTPNGKFWHFDIDAAGIPGWDNNGADMTTIGRYVNGDGPCQGKALGTCRLDTRVIWVDASNTQIESMSK